MPRCIILAVAVLFLFIQCTQERLRRNFFSELKGYPNFISVERDLSLFGFDSLIIDSLSTTIEGKNYWYLNTAKDGVFNLNGYIRKNNNIIYIRTGDKSNAATNIEQILFDFSEDPTKNWIVEYERDNVKQSIRLAINTTFYNKLISDSVFIYTALHEQQNTSLSKEFLIQASLKKGLVSFLYLDRGNRRIYTIDYLPNTRFLYENVTTPLYQTQ